MGRAYGDENSIELCNITRVDANELSNYRTEHHRAHAVQISMRNT